MCQIADISSFSSWAFTYTIHVHLFNADDLILLFNCVCQSLAKTYFAGPHSILLCRIVVLTLQLEGPTNDYSYWETAITYRFMRHTISIRFAPFS